MNASDLCDYADITYRQLDHWCRQGYIKAQGENGNTPGSGIHREFSDDEADKARNIRCLTHVGFEVHQAEKIAQSVKLGNVRIHLGHGVTIMYEKHRHRRVEE